MQVEEFIEIICLMSVMVMLIEVVKRQERYLRPKVYSPLHCVSPASFSCRKRFYDLRLDLSSFDKMVVNSTTCTKRARGF